MSVEEVTEGLIRIIKENMIAQANLVSDALTGDVLINVEDSFHFEPSQEIVFVDDGYNDSTSPHYERYEYAVVKEINNTHWITLEQSIQDTNGWLVSNNAFIQKTIGHSPLYDENVLYGDREVIPSTDMAIAIEPVSLSNEWIYLQGGLSEEYRMSIIVYGKDLETEEGLKIMNKYTDALKLLFNSNMHIDINNYESPLLDDVTAGATTVIVADTSTNREEFKVSTSIPDDEIYEVQDNMGIEIDLFCTAVSTPGDGNMYISLSQNNPNVYGVQPLSRSYFAAEYAVFRKHGRYMYDSRVDNVEYGVVQKGSALIRAARLNWFGKEVVEYSFPQKSLGVPYFKEIDPSSSSSSGP